MANVVDVTTIQDERNAFAERINIPAGKEHIMNQGAFPTAPITLAAVLRAKEAAQKDPLGTVGDIKRDYTGLVEKGRHKNHGDL